MKFELVARGNMYPGGQAIHTGDTYSVNINISGVSTGSLLANDRYRDTILHQLSAQGLDLARTGYLSYGQWIVKSV